MLDDKDKLIIEYLMHDCRITTTKLAQATNLKQPTITYRIKQLEKKGYIDKYDVLCDYNKFNVKMSLIMLRIPKNKIAMFEEYCLESNIFMTVVKHISYYNYSITAYIKQHQRKKVFDYFKKEKYIIKEYLYDKIYYSPFSIFDLNIPNTHLKETNTKLELDESDIKILNRLQNNGAKDSMLELAKNTNLSIDLVIYRFKRLKNAGYLKLFLAQPNTEKLHISYEVIFLKLDNITEKEVMRKLDKIKKSVFIGRTADNTYVITIMSTSFDNYKSNVNKYLKEFEEYIVSFHESLVDNRLYLNKLNFKQLFE